MTMGHDARKGGRPLGAFLGLTAALAVVVLLGSSAGAAIVATVPLGTAGEYAVLGATTVTNTGGTTINGSLGLSPGSSITGFPPGQVVPPGRTDVANAASAQAQNDLTTAYNNAAGRPLDATVTADLANLTLQGGVYAGPNKSALSLSGPLTLDGANNPDSVWIFQTDSSLTTASGSTVRLINGAQACNVFFLVGSSATLGTSSTFIGTILAQTSVTVTNSVNITGRTLARGGAVTLDTNNITRPTCAQAQPTTTSTTVTPTTTTSTTSTTSTTVAPTTTTSTTTRASTTTGAPTTTSVARPSVTTSTTARRPGSGVTSVRDTLPTTGAPVRSWLFAAALAFLLGALSLRFGKDTEAR